MKVVLIALIGVLLSGTGYFVWQRHVFQYWLADGQARIASYQGAKQGGLAQSWPPLVQEYLGKVLNRSGQSPCHIVRFRQKGLFRMAPSEALAEFNAEQIVSLKAPMFAWHGHVMARGLPVTVCDRLVDGVGDLEARLLGAIRVAKASGPSILRGELLRYLAEIPWYPIAIGNQDHIRWQQVGPATVKATITLGQVSASVDFSFEDGLIKTIYVADRERMVGSKSVPTPWLGEFSDYQSHGGMLVPSSGEVSWLLPSGKFTYFKGQISDYQLVCDQRGGD